MYELTWTCERCFQAVAAEPWAVPPAHEPVICGACRIAQELSAEQRAALERNAVTEGAAT